MAVYTRVGDADLAAFLENYALGACLSFQEIAEGVENSNFLLQTTHARYILTIFEKRVAQDDLPWFMGLMAHLNGHGLECPRPVAGQDGQVLRPLLGKMAAITTFLPGRPATELTADQCHEAGHCLAQLHLAARGYAAQRANDFGPAAWEPLLNRVQDAATPDNAGPILPLIAQMTDSLPRILAHWPRPDALPSGHIHADFFPDNVFFGEEGKISGVIDFYFACSDRLAYDLAIALNAWCFPDDRELSPILSAAMLAGYQSVRPLTDAEKAALPLLAQGGATRFLLTRLYDWISTPADALVTRKDPASFMHRLQYWQKNRALELS
ncbi:homoserine kinase [Candidatus Kirkpatrickella diaphorinae]|uniref:Homoserine kinase n=1 Tax=Candidatus Kirkpatrickella diaphorinae TaxID=2984322 RepID=A0ABY6GLT1_9PROT|nr:homoserine kinase [Candidatus Kirkpatrickella diaphorinae]UYH51661.1 homoserine kinase [Candidatus Kirkpatrickella diaphorinae]